MSLPVAIGLVVGQVVMLGNCGKGLLSSHHSCVDNQAMGLFGWWDQQQLQLKPLLLGTP